ncbi:MAG: alanine racemase [Lachnospiraceae bacterium]|nr:alanine racemase [Lachnospiraceae bacterium]
MNVNFDRVCAKIELSAIQYNISQISRLLSDKTGIIAVIKTDGYGHGALPMAKELEKTEVIKGYGVATAEEAMQLKNNGIRKPVIIIGYSFPSSYEEMLIRDVRLTVFREDMLDLIEQTASRLGLIAKVHIKVDTGMSRIGISPDDEGMAFVKKALSYPHISVEGIFSHFARADETDKTYAVRQLERFDAFVDRVKSELGFEFKMVHIANSAAIIEMPKSHKEYVRAGVIMYGLWPSDEVSRDVIDLKPLLSLVSHITFIKEVPAGTQVSYGGTYVTNAPTKIATIPVGYGDGFPRLLSNKGSVIISGKKAPIIGRICMDQFMVDITDIPDVHEGDEVTLIGRSGDECITMEDLAEQSGMLNYELACIMGKRVPRAYMRNGEVVYTRDFFDDTPLHVYE